MEKWRLHVVIVTAYDDPQTEEKKYPKPERERREDGIVAQSAWCIYELGWEYQVHLLLNT